MYRLSVVLRYLYCNVMHTNFYVCLRFGKKSYTTGSSLWHVSYDSQGAFLNLGGSISVVLLDTAWTRVSWDGGMENSHEDEDSSGEATPVATPLLSSGAWETLEKQLSRDSELRLLIVVMRVSSSHAPFNREPTQQHGVTQE